MIDVDAVAMGAAQFRVREVGGTCLESPDANGAPEVIAICGRTPWPSIRGNPPLDPERPYWDGRRLESENV